MPCFLSKRLISQISRAWATFSAPAPLNVTRSVVQFSVLAIFGLINAFNMLDGIDGLLAMLVIATLLSFHIFTNTESGLFSLYLMSALAGFLVSNLSLSRLVPQCFLGDAGSKLLGFIVVLLLLSAASEQVGGEKLIKPVTALYLVAIPCSIWCYNIAKSISKALRIQSRPFTRSPPPVGVRVLR